MGSLLLRRSLRLKLGARGGLTSGAERQKAIALIRETNAGGANLVIAGGVPCWVTGTVWTVEKADGVRLAAAGADRAGARRTGPRCCVPRQSWLDSSCYRILHKAWQCQRRGRARSPQKPRTLPRLRADCPNRGMELGNHRLAQHGAWGLDRPLRMWLMLYQLSSRLGWFSGPAWRIPNSGPSALAANKTGNRHSSSRPTTTRPSRCLLAEWRAATLESRQEELGVLRSICRPRVSSDNLYSESLFRTINYRP